MHTIREYVYRDYILMEWDNCYLCKVDPEFEAGGHALQSLTKNEKHRFREALMWASLEMLTFAYRGRGVHEQFGIEESIAVTMIVPATCSSEEFIGAARLENSLINSDSVQDISAYFKEEPDED